MSKVETRQTPVSSNEGKVSVVELQEDLLRQFYGEVGFSISRQEYDLLAYSLMTSDEQGFVRFFSHCEKTDFAIETYKSLHKKITRIYPDLKLDSKIRFFFHSNYYLRTQEEIEAIVKEFYSKPTPLSKICSSKNIAVRWFEADKTNDAVNVMRWKISNTLAREFSKAILSKADDDSFSWVSEGKLCVINIGKSEFAKFFGNLTHHRSKTVREGVAKLEDIFSKTPKPELIAIFFHTKDINLTCRDESDNSRNDADNKARNKKDYFTQIELKKRGWTPRLIDKYLGEPDTYFYNAINRFYPTHGYEIKKVLKIESTSTFKKDRDSHSHKKK